MQRKAHCSTFVSIKIKECQVKDWKRKHKKECRKKGEFEVGDYVYCLDPHGVKPLGLALTGIETPCVIVAHGKEGPASRWALEAVPGSFLGFAGPSTAKVDAYFGDWYLVAADPSALPVAAAALEAMPRDAKGIAVFEVTHEDDKRTVG